MLYVFTSCALNFVPCARLLAASVKTHMPDARFVLVLTDDRPETFRLEGQGFDEVLYLDDFVDQLGNPRGWAFGHDIMELATAIKPFTAARLMERDDCDAVMFFDPDCVLFGPMTEMRAALQSNSIVLTPHASLMHENQDWLFFERNPLKVGGFNLGFFGLRNNDTGRAVASWWRFRLRDHCLIAPEQGLFTDQKWMDLLPCYTDDIRVMREPVYNVARWNTFQRRISKKTAGKDKAATYLADGAPIQFVHFSGFTRSAPMFRAFTTTAPRRSSMISECYRNCRCGIRNSLRPRAITRNIRRHGSSASTTTAKISRDPIVAVTRPMQACKPVSPILLR